jgi:hypothetical protein
VVARDAPNAVTRVSQYCQEHARCDVLTVSDPDLTLQPAAATLSAS